jgi:hypothetical protein
MCLLVVRLVGTHILNKFDIAAWSDTGEPARCVNQLGAQDRVIAVLAMRSLVQYDICHALQ